MNKHERPYRCKELRCIKRQDFTYSSELLRYEREMHRKQNSFEKLFFCSHEICKRSSKKGFRDERISRSTCNAFTWKSLLLFCSLRTHRWIIRSISKANERKRTRKYTEKSKRNQILLYELSWRDYERRISRWRRTKEDWWWETWYSRSISKMRKKHICTELADRELFILKSL